MLEIDSNEDYLMDSLKNFKPPKEVDKSMTSIGEKRKPMKIIAGSKNEILDPDIDDVKETQLLLEKQEEKMRLTADQFNKGLELTEKQETSFKS